MPGRKDEFRPRLGRIRSSGGRASKRYLGKLYAAIEKARPGAFARRSGGRFVGARIGRGAGLGAAFAYNKHPFANFRSRRVAVKIRSVRLGAKGLAKMRTHLNYIQRDGADKEGAPGKLYGPDRDVVDGNAFAEEGKGDRHQFRVIISPEESRELSDLNTFTRDVMTTAEKDLGTKLDWVAVNHYDTDHPHMHVVIRGKADDGKDLVIARDYITHGFRKRAEEIATLELGQRRDLEIAKSRFSEVEKERFTSLDRELNKMGVDGAFELANPRTPYDRFRNQLLAARLRALEKMKLAHRNRQGWRLSDELETSLKELGRRGDIIRSMDAVMGKEFAPASMREFGGEGAPQKLIGCVAGSGAADDDHDKRFLAIDGVDSNQWHVAVDMDPGATPPKGAIVECSRGAAKPKKSDQTIAAIAERNSGVYSNQLHALTDPKASAEFRLAHKRRLEALRRAGHVERKSDGTWVIPENYLDRARQYEAGKSAAKIRVLSWVRVDQLIEAKAVTVLDDVLEGKDRFETVRHKFGNELTSSITARRRWLMTQGLAKEADEQLKIDRAQLRNLEKAAMQEAGSKLANEHGKTFVAVADGGRVEGKYRGPVDLPQGRYAIVEKSKEFTLVPWRATLERKRGIDVSGVMKRGGVSWSFGKNRGGPGR